MVVESGIYYGTELDPQKSGTKVRSGSESGIFSSILADLSSGTLYYFRAYANDHTREVLGEVRSFTTKDEAQEIIHERVWEEPRVKPRASSLEAPEARSEDADHTDSSDPILNHDLVAYYPFNGNGYDVSGNRNNGKANDKRVFQRGAVGVSGGCADFSQGEDFIECDGQPFNFGHDPFTFSAWVKIKSFSFDGKWGTIIEKNNYGPHNKSPFLLVTHEGKVGFGAGGWYTNPKEIVIGTKILRTGTWYHIVGVRAKDSQKIYINGELDASAVMSNLNSGNSYDLYIGRRQTLSDSYSCSFNGYIDEMGIWGRALTPDEIGEIYINIDWIDE